MKLSHRLHAGGFQLKELADGTDLQDAVTLAQLGNLGPLLGLQVLEQRVTNELLARLPARLDQQDPAPIDLKRMRKRLLRART